MKPQNFHDVFGSGFEADADAPGRVNMIGDHTDYNEGFVLPIAIPQRTRVQLARGASFPHQAYSANLAQRIDFDASSALGFARYLAGCIAVIEERGCPVPPLRIFVESSVPAGIGLSSSAALEVAMLRALDNLLRLAIGPVEIAQLAQRAEVEYAGVHCGIMDQMAASLASTAQMLLIDTRSLEMKLTPLPSGADFMVVDSGVTRNLASSAYNERREECARAAAMLGVRALRDVTDTSDIEELPSPLRERARHVVTENARVLSAAAAEMPSAFGALMNDSHVSLRDDFAVSVPQLDQLVAALQDDERVFGARMTGAGFGGACVALIESGSAHMISAGLMTALSSSATLVVPQARGAVAES